MPVGWGLIGSKPLKKPLAVFKLLKNFCGGVHDIAKLQSKLKLTNIGHFLNDFVCEVFQVILKSLAVLHEADAGHAVHRIGKDFKGFALTDFQSSADFLGDDHSAKVINSADNTSCFHSYHFLSFIVSLLQHRFADLSRGILENFQHTHHFLFIKGNPIPIDAVFCLVIEKDIEKAVAIIFLRSAIRNDVDFIPIDRGKVLGKPLQLCLGDCVVIILAATLRSPRDDNKVITVPLKGVQTAGKGRQINKGLCLLIRESHFVFKVVEPVGDIIQPTNCSVHIEAQLSIHFLYFLSLFFVS